MPVREAAIVAGIHLHSNMALHCMADVLAGKRELQYVAVMSLPAPTAWGTRSSIVPALVRLGGLPIDWPCCVWVTISRHVFVPGKSSYTVTHTNVPESSAAGALLVCPQPISIDY